MSDFSIVIASYNEGTQLLATMAAVSASLTGEADVELVVADDCSADGSGTEAAALGSKLSRDGLTVKVVRTPCHGADRGNSGCARISSTRGH